MSSLIIRANSGSGDLRKGPARQELSLVERHRDGASIGAAQATVVRKLALTACQTLHVRPHETVWELAAGAGYWTVVIAEAAGRQATVVGLVADEGLYGKAQAITRPGATFLHMPALDAGLRPILSGYKITEVPVSWVNRTADMGSSSFRLFDVGPGYAAALFRTLWEHMRSQWKTAHR